MSIALLYEYSEMDEMGIKLTAEELGINLVILPFNKISLCINNGTYSLRGKRKNYSKMFKDIEVVLNRTQSKNRRLLATNILEAFGKYVINPSQIEFICFSKVRNLLHFWKNGVEMPKTVYVPCNPEEHVANGGKIYNEEDIADLIQQELGSNNIVIKPDAGTHGRNVQLAKNRDDLLMILKTIKPSITNPVGVLAQEFIQKWFYDLRIIVSKEKNKPPYCHPKAMARGGFKDFRTNTYLGNLFFGVELPLNIREKAIKCAKAVGKNNDAWLLALDAMINYSEDNSEDDEYIQSELTKLQPYFTAISKVKSDKNKRSHFKEWNKKLENAFKNYENSESYVKIQHLIEKSIEQKKDQILFHETNSCPEFWEQTRQATGINIAKILFKCAQSIKESND